MMGQSDMNMLFPEVKEQVKSLKSSYTSGELSYSALNKELFDLMICDGDGIWWMIGYNTLKWYFHNNATGTWHEYIERMQ